ncbi:MAG: hypothetical protein ACI4M8_04985 [Christensenellales bacterium]
MADYRIKDYETICFNLLVKLGRVNAEKERLTQNLISAETKRIMKAEKCDKLAALKKYKAELFNELVRKKKSDGTKPSKE